MNQFDFDAAASVFNLKNALRLCEISLLAYETEAEIRKQAEEMWGFNDFEFFNTEDTHVSIIANDAMIILVFRGTESLHNWFHNLDAKLIEGPWGSVHEGFSMQLGYVLGDLEKSAILSHAGKRLWITGHSSGGAMATLAAAKLSKKGRKINGLYTFGQPRVGNEIFTVNFNEKFKDRFFRFVNNADIVTRVPWMPVYKHAGSLRYFDCYGKLYEKKTLCGKIFDNSVMKIFPIVVQNKMLQKFFSVNFDDHDLKRYLERIRGALKGEVTLTPWKRFRNKVKLAQPIHTPQA